MALQHYLVDPASGGFDFDPRTRVVFGPGVLAKLGELARPFGRRVLLVTDPGLRDAGHEARVIGLLTEAGLEVAVFDDVYPNPTTDDVARGTVFARDVQPELLIGLGGGSSMDCAKGINFLLTNGGTMADYRGIGKARAPMLPLIAIPTTAGTGSEAQSFAVIADARTHVKMACGDKKAAARIALLDPELTVTMPAAVTAVTGIDAISHAVESYVSTLSNTVSRMFAKQAWELLNPAFARVLENPADLTARGDMLWGAHLAGAAIENSMLGAAHALSNPLTARFNVTHGTAIGIFLPHVVRYNTAVVGQRYCELARAAGLPAETPELAAEALAQRLESLVQRAGQPAGMRLFGVSDDDLPEMAREAAEQWTGRFNPRPVSEPQLLEIYQCALS
jgi:alcohol dehydrogenase